MKQVWLTKTGDPDVLEVREAPDPEPKPGEVCIHVEAAGINFADLMARFGVYPDAPPLPAVMGYEVGGTVARVGAGVTAVRPGDAVFAMTRFGGYSSMVCVPEIQVFHRPEGMSAEDGAAIPVNYLTAFQAMIVMGGLRDAAEVGGRRMRVLVHSAAGGVGTAAADLGRLYDAELFGTASAAKHDFARTRGYHHLIDYRTEDFADAVRDLTDGGGVDLILDAVGGESWAKSLQCLAPTGRVVVFGFSTAAGGGKLGALAGLIKTPWLKFSPLSLISHNHGVLGVNVGHLWRERARVGEWANRLVGLYAEGHIRPHIDRVFAFEDAPAAHQYIEDRKNRGKVLLRP